MTKEKKNLFDRALDALTNRDEKMAEVKAAINRSAATKAGSEKVVTDRAAASKRMADKAAASQKAAAEHVSAMKADRERVGALKNGVVNVQSLRIRADHNTTSEVVGGLVHENDVTILSTWSDGRNTWAKLDNGWAAMVYDGETYIKSAKSTSEIEPNWKYDYKKE